MLQTLAQAWIGVMQDPDQVLKKRSRLSNELKHDSEKGEIDYEYSTTNPD